jgi:HEAT repeat protein
MTTLRLAVLVFAGLILLLTMSVAGVRATRIARERRRNRLAAAPRRALLAFVAEGGEEGMEGLLAIPPSAWRAAEPAAIALLGKVRGEAHAALAEVFDRRGATDRAMADLAHRGPVRRARAAELLGDLRRVDAVKPLCRLLADRTPAVRVVAVRALGAIGDAAAAEPLLESLTRDVPAQMVADALSRIGVGAIPALHEALRHDDPLVTVTALESLALIGATGSVDLVAETLSTRPEEAIGIAALTALGRLGGRASLAPLLAAIEPGNPPTVRATAARALGEVGATATGEALAGLLHDPAYDVAHQAARALVKLGPRGLAQLHDVSDDTSPDGQAAEHAREALAMAALTGG